MAKRLAAAVVAPAARETAVWVLRESSMWGRPREETVCLTCDIRERAVRGEHPAAIAIRFGIPRFLVEAVLEGDAHPTHTPRR